MIPSPRDPQYGSLAAADAELERVFDICHGCRRCFNLCPSFHTLFKKIDEKENLPGGRPASSKDVAAEVAALAPSEKDRVVDECYQCKLCYNHCPYTPPHRFAVDFPRLLLRAKAARVRAGGVAWIDKLLARVDLLGKINSRFGPLVNLANRNAVFRWALERVAGIDRRRNLPRFFRETFTRWYARFHLDWRPSPKPKFPRRAALFPTCFVEYNDPNIGRAAVAVLERNGVETFCPAQKCCGMPFLDAGDVDGAARAARENVAALLPAVRRGTPVLVLGPTCSYMLKREYPYLLGTPEADEVAAATRDVCEYLMELRAQNALDTDFAQWPPGQSIAYQIPCHLKAQNIGFKSRDLLSLLPGGTVRLVDRCSAHDGTWSMKTEWFDLSMKTAQKFFDEMSEGRPDWIVSDCPLAGLQLEKGMGRKGLHPVQVLAHAYGLLKAER